MKTICVNASASYKVKIGSGLLDHAAEEIRAVSVAKNLCIVSDHTVWALYGDELKDNLTDAGYRCVAFTFPAGEQSKCGRVYLQLLDYLAQAGITRSDCLIALGGGVVGDLTGFAAATYLRGIDYIQMPTTLLAAVDSSVGGKTAIDLPSGKNLAGAFYQPKLVLCDIDTLDTLPREIFRDGCAEVVKYGILYDRQLFSELAEDGLEFDRESVIARCVDLKRQVVAEDEFDTGARMKLNLGHTIGHGVESCSHYAISHGKAVAIGMAVIARSAANAGICSAATESAILSILQKFALPSRCDYSAQQLLQPILSDKKRKGGYVHLILPQQIGQCIIRPFPVEELLPLIQAGL